jgi:hypothetical protein
MGSLFQDGAAIASAAVDTVYGEPFLYQPMAAASGDVNARSATDSGRSAMPVTAAFFDAYARAFSGPLAQLSQGRSAELPGHSSGRPLLDLDFTQLPYEPRRGDRVQRQAPGDADGVFTGQVFEVAECRPDKTGPRGELDLNLIS